MLKLSENLELPASAVTQTFAFLGKRGGGKTYAAMKLCELMLEEKAQAVALDPVGVWYGLRVPKIETESAFDVLVFGGFHGDIEINPKAGRIVADIIVERSISAVVDISQFIHSEQTRFAYDFLTTLFERKKSQPSAVHVFLEEAQEIVPQNVVKGDGFGARMLHAGERLVKLGRNFGIGCSLISQRPQEVNKKVLNQSEVMLAFQMTGLQERKTIAEWVADKGERDDRVSMLPKLAVGEAYVWSPSWLHVADVYRIAEKRTADVSATPEVGGATETVKRLAPVDVEELKSAIAALVEESEAESPKNLKKQIAELKRQLNEKPIPAATEIVFPEEKIDELKKFIQETEDWITETTNSFYHNFHSEIENKLWALSALVKTIVPLMPEKSEMPKKDSLPVINREKSPKPAPPPSAKSKMPALAQASQFLSSPQRAILNTLATFAELGIAEVDKSNLAVFAGVSPKSSAFLANLSFLRNSEKKQHNFPPLIEYTSGKVRLTDDGRDFALTNLTIDSLDELHKAWISYLPAKQGAMIRNLIDNDALNTYMPRRELAIATHQSETSSAWLANLSALRKFGLIEYSGKDIYLTDLLFPNI